MEDSWDHTLNIFRNKFNNLYEEKDWWSLYLQLVGSSGYTVLAPSGASTEAVGTYLLEKMFGGELVNATILFFQAQCPVRFAFLDGQARMASVHYYIRKILPGPDGTRLPLLSQFGMAMEEWTLRKTGRIASCRVIVPEEENWGAPALEGYLWLLRERSLALQNEQLEQREQLVTRLDSMAKITPTTFSDVLLRVVGAVRTTAQQHGIGEPYTVATMHDAVREVMKTVCSWLARKEVGVLAKLTKNSNVAVRAEGQGVEEYAEAIYATLFGKPDSQVVMFPSLKGKRSGLFNLQILVIMLGVTAGDSGSTSYLEDCIQKDWRAPLSELKHQCSAHFYDKATYIDETATRKNLFEKMLYLVRIRRGHI